MIKLHSRHRLVAAADGTVHSLDIEALRRELRRAFRTCGMTEDWTADHIALVIEEYAVGSGPDRPPLPERDLHAMVATLLSASGYEDVGRHYHDLIPESARPADPDPFRRWDQARVDAELAGVLPLADAARHAIVGRTTATLAGLGFTAVTAALIRDLGRHFLQQSLAEPLPTPSESPWLLLPSHWPLAAVPGADRLCGAGVIRLHPVSRFLPCLRLEFDLRCLATLLGTPPLPELVYLPALARSLDLAAALLSRTAQGLAGTLPNSGSPAVHVVVSGLTDTLAEALLPPSARAAKALKSEIRAVIDAKLHGHDASDILLTFR